MNIKNYNLYVGKSFIFIGTSLNNCFGCDYCRARHDIKTSYLTLPGYINPLFKKLPVVINCFYGDPLLQIQHTINILYHLELNEHTGPVIIITKGDFSKFPDIQFDLNLHVAFSTFGPSVNDRFNGGLSFDTFVNNLECAMTRNNMYKYSIEFRPIIYGINDDKNCVKKVIDTAMKYGLPIGYSGLQGKPEMVMDWISRNIPFYPYPGYSFGHKKLISDSVESMIISMAKERGVFVFRKTSCLLSFVHSMNRDYNAHYYRPNEVGCYNCKMKNSCENAKGLRDSLMPIDDGIIPFDYKIVYKDKHECCLKTNGICNFPTDDCSNINGGIISIEEQLTTADVRIIKWLTGYTVDAQFYESPFISHKWVSKGDE